MIWVLLYLTVGVLFTRVAIPSIRKEFAKSDEIGFAVLLFVFAWPLAALFALGIGLASVIGALVGSGDRDDQNADR